MRYGTGMALVLAAGTLWSFQALIIRQIGDAGPWTILFWRSLAMLPVLLLFISWRSGGSPLPAIRKAGSAGILGGIGLIAAIGGAIAAFQWTTVANAAFLLAASPFLAALLGRAILGEAVAPRTWTAIAIALVGIFVMVREGLAAGAGWVIWPRLFRPWDLPPSPYPCAGAVWRTACPRWFWAACSRSSPGRSSHPGWGSRWRSPPPTCSGAC